MEIKIPETYPTHIETKRLRLRCFQPEDAQRVANLVGTRDIADMTQFIPHPYHLEDGIQWIASHAEDLEKKRGLHLAMVLKESQLIVGAISLMFTTEHDRAEIGYWIGKEYWGKGICTEAALAVLDYGFTELNLNKIFAVHFKRNPASGRVLEKIGMKYEGCQYRHVQRNGRYEDLCLYGILREHHYRM